jgi:hypothetical protein
MKKAGVTGLLTLAHTGYPPPLLDGLLLSYCLILVMSRMAKRWLWVYPDPVPPWEWRHRMSPVGQGQMRPN